MVKEIKHKMTTEHNKKKLMKISPSKAFGEQHTQINTQIKHTLVKQTEVM